MATVTLGGNPVNVGGSFPAKGSAAPDFTLTAKDLKDLPLSTWAGKRKILNIVPSLDTPTCQKSTRVFNEKANALSNTVVLVVSGDLPFAMSRFCGAEGLENVKEANFGFSAVSIVLSIITIAAGLCFPLVFNGLLMPLAGTFLH